jgi:ABC-type multidrug transport system ATPase subunit
MIRIEGLTCRFGRQVAVDNLSLEIGAGDSVALWGVNGAGKTTVIRSVLGLVRHRGKITVNGVDIRRKGKHARRMIGYVPQELGFYDDLRLSEAVSFFARLKGLRVRRSDSVLEQVGLPGQGRKRVRELSGGMKQRLALAIAMLGEPPILILDEVTASLDACGREEFVSLLSRLSGSGRTMLFASHRVEEVTTLARRVVMLEKGELVREVPAARFAPHLGVDAVLHLFMEQSVRGDALRLLNDRGFDARMNGAGLLVHVASEQKAGPFRVLAEERIAIEDFDLLLGTQAADHSGGHEESRS